MDVVLYLRMSSDPQERSIGDQRTECLAYAARQKYTIVREYIDEGISGSKGDVVRAGFLQMISDAQSLGDFSVVVCWDVSRFGRQDYLDGGTPKKILRTAGVSLDTVKEGLIDWATTEGRWKDFAFSEFASQYSRSLSRDSLRGRRQVLLSGSWPHGQVPFGYLKCYLDEEGKEHRMPRGVRYTKPRRWRLVLKEDPAEGRVVRRIYREYTREDLPLRGIATRLNHDQVAPPQGKAWNKDSVKNIIKNPAYAGVATIGDGHVKPTGQAFHRAEVASKTGVCDQLIDPQEWQAANRRLAANEYRPHSGKSSALSGCLVCDHCGYRLSKAGKYFRCASGSRGRTTCPQWNVREDEILPIVINKVVKKVDAELLQQVEWQAQGRPPTDITLLERHAEELKKQVETASKSFLLHPNLQASLAGPLAALQADLQSAEETLALRRATAPGDDLGSFSEEWERIKPSLIHIPAVWGQWEEDCEMVYRTRERPPVDCTPDALRGFLKRLGLTVRLRWKKYNGKGPKQFELEEARLKVEVRALESLGSDRSTTRQRILFRFEAVVRIAAG